MYLVIAEKPSVSRAIAEVIGAQEREDGYLQGTDCMVSWCFGHLAEYVSPDAYDEKFNQWRYEDLPIIPKDWKVTVSEDKKDQFYILKRLLNSPEIEYVVNACDAGREGELIFKHVYDLSGSKKPVKRLWISSLEDSAILDGMQHLRSAEEYRHLAEAAVCRSQADWLVGMNATRAYTTKYFKKLTVGRVQTPTLAMLVERAGQISNFQKEKYFNVELDCDGIPAVKPKIFDPDEAEQLRSRCQGSEAIVTAVKETEKKVKAPKLYDLTTLQREANRKYGYSAKQTLNIMQRLYENHKVLTYPRTDSRYIGKDIVPTIKERLRACATGPYRKPAGALMNQPVRANGSFVDDKKVSDHHAIIPTEQFVQLDHMTYEERKIYDMVVRRFLSVLYPPFVYEQVSMEGIVAGELFAASGKVVKSAGWKDVYENTDDTEEDEDTADDAQKLKDQKLPQMKKGERLHIENVSMNTGRTKPPARFTEATLLAAMENPVRYMESHDTKAAKTLGETGGLGPVATRADIIEKLFNSFLMEKKGNEIHLTSKAKQLLELVPEELRKPELTADWEMKLGNIAKGKMKQETFLKEIRNYTCDIVDEIKTGQGTFRHDNLTNKICPNCGKKLLAVNGKNAKMLVCQDRECGYKETLSRTTNARCPKCHKRMEMYVKGKEETFICACGYKEKLSAFQARRAKEGAGVNKREVQKYMRQQQKEAKEPVNNAFAQALAGLKLE